MAENDVTTECPACRREDLRDEAYGLIWEDEREREKRGDYGPYYHPFSKSAYNDRAYKRKQIEIGPVLPPAEWDEHTCDMGRWRADYYRRLAKGSE